MFDALPEAFGSYRVLEAIGTGRFGPVYRAREDATGLGVAIKVFDQQLTSDQASRLAAVLERLKQMPLEHPAIVPIVAAGAMESRAWVAEPWFDATPLDLVMQRGGAQLPADVVVRITQIAGALDFAAAVGIHHGALHPRDILVSDELTVLSGLGVLQALADAGLVVPMEGAYVSAQRAQGLPVAGFDDIFSIGAITYELLYGVPVPPRSELRASATALTGIDASRLADVLLRALSPDPSERPSSALEFAAAIQTALAPAHVPARDAGLPSKAMTPDPAPIPAPAPIPDPAPRSNVPVRDSDFHSEIAIRESVSHPPVPVSIRGADSAASVADLPLRTMESEARNRKRPVERPNESSPEYGYWFVTTATLAIGLLMGFASGYVVGQRDGTPTPQSAERAVARSQRPASPDQTPAPTTGRDFTESPVPESTVPESTGPESTGPPATGGTEQPRIVTEQPVIPEPSDDRNAATGTAARMEPSERAAFPSAGVLQVDSRPRGAHVFLDGRLVGTTPVVVPDVKPGAHAVRIDLIGHRRWVTSIDVLPGERHRVAASLER